MRPNTLVKLLRLAQKALLEAEKNSVHPSETLRKAVTEVTSAVAKLNYEKTSWKELGGVFVREYSGHHLSVSRVGYESAFSWCASPYALPSKRGCASTLEEAKRAAETATKGEE